MISRVKSCTKGISWMTMLLLQHQDRELQLKQQCRQQQSGIYSKKIRENFESGTFRPRTSTGRPISGVARPGTQMRLGSALDRLKTARPITSQSARAIRLGTAAIYSQKEGPFIQVSRLNIAKYAKISTLSKPLFEYLFYHEGDIRNAMELAVQATQFCEFQDWWWKVQLAKCYIALNLIREAEQQMRSALKQQHHVESFIRLTRIYLRLGN